MNLKYRFSLILFVLPFLIYGQTDSLNERKLQSLLIIGQRIDIERLPSVQNTFIWSGKNKMLRVESPNE